MDTCLRWQYTFINSSNDEFEEKGRHNGNDGKKPNENNEFEEKGRHNGNGNDCKKPNE